MNKDMIWYSHPWDGPTKAVVEYQGRIFEVRESWGCAEGWTNTHGATDISNDEILENAHLLEMGDAEVRESYSEEHIRGIEEAVCKAVA